MSFGESIKTVFKNLTNFKGRARRSEFWWFYLFMFLVSIPLSFLASIPLFAMIANLDVNAQQGGSIADDQIADFLGVTLLVVGLSFLFGLVVFLLGLAVWVRRLHDAGYSGHWLWLSLAGLSIVPLIFAILEGQPHENQWGPNPKAVEHGPSPYQRTSPTYAAPPPQPAPTQPFPTQPAPAATPMAPPAPASGDTSDPFAAPPPQK